MIRELNQILSHPNLTKGILLIFIIIFIFTGITSPIKAQDKQMIQLKAFNQELQAYGNIKIAVNGKSYVQLNNKGTGFIELGKEDLPVKSIEVGGKNLEAASWNLSKGILEIVIRTKSYRVVSVKVKTSENKILGDTKVTFNGIKEINTTTNLEGYFDLPLALNEEINEAKQFEITGYNINGIRLLDGDYVLLADKIKTTIPVKKNNSKDENYLKDFDITKLDSIQSLTVFYAIFKTYQIENLSPEIKNKVDAKFQALVGDLKDSLKINGESIILDITDTSYVKDDIIKLSSQAKRERDLLVQQKNEFEKKIQLVRKKLSEGFDNLAKEKREELLKEINQLEDLLVNNESQFYKNRNSYHDIINSLKNQFFDFEELESKLSVSEEARLREQEIFQTRLFIISVVAVLFILLVILLIYFSLRLKKQKKVIAKANVEVQHINENLETIVYERTKLLEETYKELDTVLYRASHDMRSAVCSIEGLCNIAYSTSVEPNQVIDRIVKTNNQMDKLLKKLSTISEIHQPGAFSKIKLKNTIQHIHNHFKPIIKENNINFEIKCADDIEINTIPDLLEIIITNLIENALYYCIMKDSKDHQVSLHAHTTEKALIISVFDNGVGVEKEITDQLFDMFYRGSTHSKGNGLGLYIVRKSVKVLNGNVTIESEPGEYSRFVIELPLTGAEEHSFDFLMYREEFFQKRRNPESIELDSKSVKDVA